MSDNVRRVIVTSASPSQGGSSTKKQTRRKRKPAGSGPTIPSPFPASSSSSSSSSASLMHRVAKHCYPSAAATAGASSSSSLAAPPSAFDQAVQFLQTKDPLQAHTQQQQQQHSLEAGQATTLVLPPPPPYSSLKGGNKPTYRAWMQTQKHPLRHLQTVQQKVQQRVQQQQQQQQLQQLQQQQQQQQQQLTSSSFSADHTTVPNSVSCEGVDNKECGYDAIQGEENQGDQGDRATEFGYNVGLGPVKQTIVRKTKQRATYGKSRHGRTVAVLVKNQNTRKHVLHAHKELKQTPLHEIKTYLRDHNMIKVGSSAPSNVVRQMYETAVLTGDVRNVNVDNMKHNLLHSDDATKGIHDSF